MTPTRDDALALDRADPLARFRDEFELPAGMIYLDGNSLGALPKATAGALARAVSREWGEGLIGSWNSHGWIDAPARVGGKIARLIGAHADEVVVADSTSVNLFKLAAGALALTPGRSVILTEAGNFPTDLYMLRGLEALLGGWIRVRAVPPDALLDAIDTDTALLVLTQVHYKSARCWDMAALTAAAQAKGALMLWDLSHSAGALRVALTGCGADLAVGCGYKHLNGGPGAPAYLFVARRHQGAMASPLTGWMGHAEPFAFDDDYRPAAGIRAQLCGTPAILGLAALEVGVDLALQADMALVEAKGRALCDLFIALTAGLEGVGLASSAGSERRGLHVALTHAEGYAVVQALAARGVIGDFRAPDIMRFGFTPLYLSHAEVWDAAAILREVIETRAFDRDDFRRRAAVT